MERVESLRIWLLGGFQVEVSGRLVPDGSWRRNRARALVKLLALAPGNRLHREQVIDILWPDLDAAAGGANLRKAAYFARQAMGPHHLQTHGDLVTLSPSRVWIDVAEFEIAVQERRAGDAVAVYRGDLLPEDRFESWTEDVRERLRTRYLQALWTLAVHDERRGDLGAAMRSLERLVTDDPLHEEAQLALIRLHALAGARHLALRRFAAFETALRRELDIEPSDETRALHDDIVAGRFPPAEVRSKVATTERAGDVDDTAIDERRLVTVLVAMADLPAVRGPVGRRDVSSWGESAGAVIESWSGVAAVNTDGTVVGVFGVPVLHEDDPSRALRAALELSSGTVPVRSGVATGDAVVRTAGPAVAESAALDTVTAARALMERAAPRSVLAAERTCRIVGDRFELSAPLQVDARGDMMPARVVSSARPVSGAPRTDVPLVGRVAELRRLTELIDDTVRGARPRLVLLTGSAGVGKSRLVLELAAAVTAANARIRVLRGRCLSGGRGAVYWALGDVLRQACAIGLNESAEITARRCQSTLRQLLGDADPVTRDETIFALAMTAGIALQGNPLERMHPDQVAERLGLAWPRFTSACAAAAPTVLVLEDLHWATSELLGMVELIVARSSGPLAVVATARPELRAREASFAPVSDEVAEIWLPPLGERDSERLLEELAGQGFPQRMHDEVLARAEGNPLYMEQLTLHVSSAHDAVLPDTLQALLAARLDTLLPAERRVLQEAAVVGRVFWEEPLRRALPTERVTARLAQLERKGFVARRLISNLPGEVELTFRHALLHDAAYESLPPARRVRAHAAVGAWLEGVAGGRADEVIDLLAHHFWAATDARAAALAWTDDERGATRARAFAYLLRGGLAARQRFAVDRALELHGRALALAATRDQRILALEAVAEDNEAIFHGDRSEAFYRQAIELAAAPPAAAAHSRLCCKLAWQMVWNPGAFAVSPDPAAVDELVTAGTATATDEADRAWLRVVDGASARLYRGSEPFGQGTRIDVRPIAQRIKTVRQALAMSAAMGREDITVAGTRALGILYGVAGRFADSIALERQAVEALGPTSTNLERCDAYRKLGADVISINAAYEEGISLARRAYELARAFGAHALMHTTFPIMDALFHLGRWDEMQTVIEEHTAAFHAEPALECGFVRDGPVIGAVMLALRGRTDEAAKLALLAGDPMHDAERATAWQSRYEVVSGRPEVALALSREKAFARRAYGPAHAHAVVQALLALEDWEQLEAFLPQARVAVDGDALLGPLADRAEGLVTNTRGEQSAATGLLRSSLRGFKRFHVPWEEARTLDALGVVLSGADAAAAKGAASALYERLGVVHSSAITPA